MKDSELAAIANPGQAGARAVAAFQDPGVNVRTTTDPRHYKFDPEDTIAQRKGPYIPAKYRGRMFDDRHDQPLAQQAETYGLETVEVILPEKLTESDPNRSDWGVVGLRGKCLKPGDREEMPVNQAMLMVQSGVAVFVVSSDTAKDEKLISDLEAKGYQFATTTKPAREREEFRKVFAPKKRTFMQGATPEFLKQD